MSLNLNHVTLAGRLTRDPELKTVGNQRQVVNFAIAINRNWKTQEGEAKEEVTFVDCEAWGRVAELVAQYLGKGSPAYLEGRLRMDVWEDKDGNRKQRMKVQVDNVQFLGRPGDRKGEAEDDAGEPTARPTTAVAPAPAAPRRRAPVTAVSEDAPPF